jgi:hypothetical protein
LGDLGCAVALRGHLCYAGFGGGERVAAGEGDPPRSCSGCQQFLVSALSESGRAALVGESQRIAKRTSGFDSVAGATDGGAVVGQSAGEFELGGGPFEHLNRLLEQVDCIAASLG